MALLKLCRCGKKISIGDRYCEECNKKVEQYKKDNNKYYDKHRRNKKSTEFYHSQEWINLRAFVLSKYKGLDLYAYYVEKRIVYASPVHHIIEIEEDWEKRLDISNLIPLSNANHNKMDALYKKDKKGTQMLLFELLSRWKREIG